MAGLATLRVPKESCVTQPLLLILSAILLEQYGYSAPISIDGGLTWSGWTRRGRSDQLGVYGSGTTSDVCEVFTTVFNFNNNTVSGPATGGASGFGTGAYSSSAFANGNLILGVEVRRISGAAINGLGLAPMVRFDLDNDGDRAATLVGGVDGRTQFSTWSEFRDFTIQYESDQQWRGSTLTMQAGNGELSDPRQIVGASDRA